MSNEKDFALTFKNAGFLTGKDCENQNTSISDQGLMVKFLDPLNITLLHTHINAKYRATGNNVALMNAMLQQIIKFQHQNIVEQFWNCYYYTCHGLSQTLKIVTMLMEKHPTMSARYMLQNPYITASIGPGVLEVFPCTRLSPALYRLLPMSSGNCTNFIPIEIKMSGSSHIGYLDPVENIVYKESVKIDCDHMQNVIVRLNGKSFQYSIDGSLSEVTNITSLKLPDVRLGAHPIKIHEAIYSNAHLLNWHNFSNHHSLNTLLATLDRQRQVLEAMGVQSTRFETLEHNVRESKEELLGRSLFAFLFGGHVASGYELWTFGCNTIITALVSLYILKKLRNRCCPNFKVPLPNFQAIKSRFIRSPEMVANVEVEAGQTQTDDVDSDECDDIEDESAIPLRPRPLVSVERECQTDIERTLVTPTAPTESSYGARDCICPALPTQNRLYPALPAIEPALPAIDQPAPVNNIIWPSFYRPRMN